MRLKKMEQDADIETLKRQLAEANATVAGLRDGEARYTALFEAIASGFCTFDMIFDATGRATDYRFVETNPSFERQSGLVDAVGRRIREFAPDIEEVWLERYGRVALTGEPMRVEGEVAPMGRWFDINAFRIGAPEQRRIAVLFTDITERKRVERQLLDSESQFRALVNATANIVYRMAPDWREMGRLDGLGFIVDTEAPTIDWLETYIPADERPRVRDAIEQAIRARGVFELEHKVLRVDGTVGWTFSRAIPLLDDDGEIVEWLGAASDVTARVKADQRFNRLFDASPAPFLVLKSDAPHFTITEVNDAYLAATMRTREGVIGRGVFEAYPDNPEDATTTGVSRLRASLERVLATRRPDELPGIRYDVARPDGTFEERWWSPVNSPILNEVGEVEAIIHNANDVTEARRAEAALRESEERFAQFAASSTDVLWIRRADTMDMVFLSPAFTTVYGMDPEAAMGAVQKWGALIVPEDRDIAMGHLETARRGEATVHEFRIRRPSDGVFRWIRDHDFPLFDATGVKWVGGIGTDVTEAKLLAEHQSVLLAELQHRVRNIMAMLRSVAKRTAATADSVASYETLMVGRLMALARTQTLLTRSVDAGVEIDLLVREELEAQADHKGQYELSGPEVMVSPKAAEILSLAIHELATNALKYGALSVSEGKVEVTWRVHGADGSQRLRLDWTEHRPASPGWSPPTRKGFGTQLIEQRVPYELSGRGEVVIGPNGARAIIEFPLQPGASILETTAPIPSGVFGGSIDMTGEPSLAGQTVLVLEDDFYLAQDASSALSEAGAEVVGPCATTADAIEAVKNRPVTAAVLDVNLGAGPSFAMAYALREAGAPFLFLTGYDHDAIPAEFADIVRLEKPIGPRDIVRAVAALAEA